MQRAKDPESISTTQRLAAAKEKCLRIDAAMFAIVEDELPIMEQIKKRGGQQLIIQATWTQQRKKRRHLRKRTWNLEKRRKKRNPGAAEQYLEKLHSLRQDKKKTNQSIFVCLAFTCNLYYWLCMLKV